MWLLARTIGREIDIMLTVKYVRNDFFGNCRYTEDSKDRYSREDVKKAFQHLSNDRFSAVQKEDTVYFWDSTGDLDNRIVTIWDFDGSGYTETKDVFDIFYRF